MKKLLLALLLCAPLAAQPQPGTPEAEAHTRVRLDGQVLSQDLSPPLSSVSLLPSPGVLLTGQGLFSRALNGYQFVSWDKIDSVMVDQESIVIVVGDPLQQAFVVLPTSATTTIVSYGSEGEHKSVSPSRSPNLKEPERFLGEFVKWAGLVGDKENGYRRGGEARPGSDPVFFPYEHPEKWSLGWPDPAIAALSSRPGVTVNETGIALVNPYQAQTMRWDELDRVEHREGDLEQYQGYALELSGKPLKVPGGAEDAQMRNSLVFNYPDAFDLYAEDFDKLRALLPPVGTSAAQAAFFPLRSKSLAWLDPSGGSAESRPSPSLLSLPEGAGWWPAQASVAGLYLLPEGLMEIDRQVVRRVPWDTIEDLTGDVYGSLSLTVKGYPFLLAPVSTAEVPSFLSFRRDVVRIAGLIATGEEYYLAPEEGQRGELSAGYYPLSSASAWTGLPLSLLGETAWENGLHFLPEGVVSVEDHRIAMTPWQDFQLLDMDPADDSVYLKAAPKGQSFDVYPPGAVYGETYLAVSEKQAREALARFVTVSPEGPPELRSDRPNERIFLPYKPVLTD